MIVKYGLRSLKQPDNKHPVARISTVLRQSAIAIYLARIPNDEFLPNSIHLTKNRAKQVSNSLL